MPKPERSKTVSSLFDNNSIKVVVIGCAAIIIALLIMSSISLMIMNNAVVSKLKTSDLSNLAASIGAVIEGKIEKAAEVSVMLASDPVTVGWLQGAEGDQVAGGLVRQKMIDAVDTLGYDTSFLVNNVTKHYWSYHKGTFELLDTVSTDDADDDWFFTAMTMHKRYEINIDHNKELDDTFVWINTLVGDLSKPVAVTGLGMNLSDVIDELIRDDEKSKVKNDIWLVDGAGMIYLSKDPQHRGRTVQELLPASIVEQMTAGQGGSGEYAIEEYVDAAGERYDLAYKGIKDTAWKLLVQIPRSETVGFLGKVTWNTVISCVVIILLMVATFYWLANRIANPYQRALQLNQELERVVGERTSELQEKNAKINDSLEYAKMIQQTILPTTGELQRNLRQHFVIYQPRDTVGGDFYWMRSEHDGCWLVVGDCTGHGVPGALMTTAVNAMLNSILDAAIADPAVVLGELERLLKQAFSQEGGGESISDGLDAAVLRITRAGEIRFAAANLSLFVSDLAGVREIKGTSTTIDCNPTRQSKVFATHQLISDAAATFYVATDGFKDQPGGEKRLPFGKGRLLALLAEVRDLELDQQRQQLLQALADYAGSEVRRDDITLVAFRL